MRRTLPLSLVLFAWLLATGSQWHLVQGFAWGRMLVAYASTMPLREAVRLTFTPDNMCGVCELVSAAERQNPGDSALPVGASLDSKTFLVFQPVPSPVLAIPLTPKWLPGDSEIPTSERIAPPLPPPRPIAS